MRRVTPTLTLLLALLFALGAGTAAQPEDDHGDAPEPLSATLVQVDGPPISAELAVTGDVDCFMFEAVAGLDYAFAAEPEGEKLDLLLLLFDRQDAVLLAVDDGGQARGAALDWTAPAGGFHFVCVRNARATEGTGSYRLTIQTASGGEPREQEPEAPQDPGDDADDPAPPQEPPDQPREPEPAASSGTGHVGVLGADDAASVADVVGFLRDTGAFAGVESVDVATATPTLTQLEAFEAVLVWSDEAFADAEALGNALADYADAGGGVVVAAVSFDVPSESDPDTLGGRFLSGGYYAIRPEADNVDNGRRRLGELREPDHPILSGVDRVDGGLRSYHSPTSALSSGARALATWDDRSVLAAVKAVGDARRADLNLFPPSSRVSPELWPFTPFNDVDHLFANALLWVAGRR